MAFGFKYHVVTVCAIFFALTVGLVVGSLLVSPKVADKQQRAIVNLTDKLNEDLSKKEIEKEQNDRAMASIVPAAIKGRLQFQKFAIIQTGDYVETTSILRETLTQAGAQVVSITAIGPEMDRTDEVLLPALATLQQSDNRFPTDRASLASAIATVIGKADVASAGIAAMLEHENYIHRDPGIDFQAIPKYVVIVAGSKLELSDRVINVDQPLIASLQKLGVTVLMCENSDVHVSDVPNYRRLMPDVTTIDNIDDPKGKCSLVFAVGGEVGNYGIKPSASYLLPPELTRFEAH